MVSFKARQRNQIQKLKSDGKMAQQNVKRLKINILRKNKPKEMYSTMKLLSFGPTQDLKSVASKYRKKKILKKNKKVLTKVNSRKKLKISRKPTRLKQTVKLKSKAKVLDDSFLLMNQEEINEFTSEELKSGIQVPAVRERKTMPPRKAHPLALNTIC